MEYRKHHDAEFLMRMIKAATNGEKSWKECAGALDMSLNRFLNWVHDSQAAANNAFRKSVLDKLNLEKELL